MPIAKSSLALLFILLTAPASRAADLNVLPQPKHVEVRGGTLSLRSGFLTEIKCFDDTRIERAVDRLYDRLSMKLGFVVLRRAIVIDQLPVLEIECANEGAEVQAAHTDESYRLEISAEHAVLHANDPIGVLRGLETVLQLATQSDDGYGHLPALLIEDAPRFAWRGLLLDVARHFQPLENLKRHLDGMAAIKMNVLHLHLSDDQGFRVQSEKLPELTRVGSHGQFYTRQEIRELVAYARDRGIRILPEFDIPGHSIAWLEAYPELAVKQEKIQPATRYGGYANTLDPSNPKLMKLLDRFFDEMAELFPDEYVHIGGDEVDYRYWNESGAIAEFRKKHNLEDSRAVQAHFNAEVEKILRKHDKKMMGWTEILHGDLPKSIVIHNWVQVRSLQETLQRGYSTVVSLGYYLDWYMPAGSLYLIDPVRPSPEFFQEVIDRIPGITRKELETERDQAKEFEIPADAEKLVLGGEAAEWTEITTPWTIDAEIWPRLGAVAERFWSPAEVRDVSSLYRRLEALNLELSDLGLRHEEELRVLRQRLAGSREEAESLDIFAEAVEPLKYYTRHLYEKKSGNYVVNGRFNRFTDAVPPESRVASRFRRAVNSYLETGDAIHLAFLRTTLLKWRANEKPLTRLVSRNPRLKDVAPLADSLHGLTNLALDAIAYLEEHQPAPAWWLQAQKSILDAAVPPYGEVRLVIVPDVKRLVEAAANQK